MGVTYRAVDKVLHRDVALKVIQTPSAADGSQDVRERFLREARSAAACGIRMSLEFSISARRPRSTIATSRWNWSRAKRSRHACGGMVRSKWISRWKSECKSRARSRPRRLAV